MTESTEKTNDEDISEAETASEPEAEVASADAADSLDADAGADADTDADADDPWASALSEQAAANQDLDVDIEAESSSTAVNAGNDVFKPLDGGSSPGTTRDLEMIMDIPVRLNVELGRTRISIKKLLELTQGSVLELDGLAGDPMDILINGYHIAQGEVVVVDERYGIRITNIITPSERVKKLNN